MTDAFDAPEEKSVADKIADAPAADVVERMKEAVREEQARKDK